MIETAHVDASDEQLVGREHAAARLGLSVRQLDRLVAAGKVTKYRREVGQFKVGYKLSELDALIQHEPAGSDVNG